MHSDSSCFIPYVCVCAAVSKQRCTAQWHTLADCRITGQVPGWKRGPLSVVHLWKPCCLTQPCPLLHLTGTTVLMDGTITPSCLDICLIIPAARFTSRKCSIVFLVWADLATSLGFFPTGLSVAYYRLPSLLKDHGVCPRPLLLSSTGTLRADPPPGYVSASAWRRAAPGTGLLLSFLWFHTKMWRWINGVGGKRTASIIYLFTNIFDIESGFYCFCLSPNFRSTDFYWSLVRNPGEYWFFNTHELGRKQSSWRAAGQMWGAKTTAVPMVNGGLEEWLQKIPGTTSDMSESRAGTSWDAEQDPQAPR